MRLTKCRAASLILVALLGTTEPAFSKTKAKAGVNQAPAPQNALILVKEFSMENTEVEGLSGKKAEQVIAKKEKRLPSVLSRKLLMRLLSNGFVAASFSANSSATTTAEVFVLDGEFVQIHKGKPRMTVRVWLYRPGDPSTRLIQSDIGAVSTAGPVAVGSVAMNNLAHNVIQYLRVTLPTVMEGPEDSDSNQDPPQ